MASSSRADLSLSLSKDDSIERIERGHRKLLALRLALGGKFGSGEIGPPVCVVFEGWDASGKGGAIKRLVAPMDPRHVRVAQFAAPSESEKRHHSPEEQLARFEKRQETPLKRWKLTDEDWRNREKRPAYESALDEMLERTGTEPAPWTVVAAESKHFARVAVLETVIERIATLAPERGFQISPAVQAILDE